MPDTTRSSRSRYRATIVAIAPAALLAALVAHPFLFGRLPNDLAVAEAVTADTTRWGLVHLATGVASGLLIIAFLAIRSHLREAGEDRYSALGVPFIVIGSTLFTLLPGMEFAPLAAAETGAATEPIAAAQEALEPWFVPVLASGALTFAAGVFGFAKGIADRRLLGPRPTALVVAALVVMAASRFVPLAVFQLYVQGAAGIVALWPLAYEMWKHPQARVGEQPRPMPAT
ncbi:MAG: hypothetical protein LC808_25730 [Actinobacteria bacterium]|nr:hypothetical protein [Actinomycetota bacterium]